MTLSNEYEVILQSMKIAEELLASVIPGELDYSSFSGMQAEASTSGPANFVALRSKKFSFLPAFTFLYYSEDCSFKIIWECFSGHNNLQIDKVSEVYSCKFEGRHVIDYREVLNLMTHDLNMLFSDAEQKRLKEEEADTGSG